VSFRTRSAATFVALVCLTACGGGGGGGGTTSPTNVQPTPAPTPTPNPVPVVFDGGTEQPLPSAAPEPALPGVGANVTVRMPGYLAREQTFNRTPIFLWPSTEEYVGELVHSWEFSDGSLRMIRWSGSYRVTLDGALANDGAAIAKTNEVLAEIARTTGLQCTLGAGGQVVISIDPDVLDEDAVAIADVDTQGATVTGGTIRFHNRGEVSGTAGAQYSNTLLHEMGHILGLGHSINEEDVMTPGEGSGTDVQRYQPNEALALHMMYAHRRAGDLPPDRDSNFQAASLGRQRFTIVDRRRR
jgi:hypothetical protein